MKPIHAFLAVLGVLAVAAAHRSVQRHAGWDYAPSGAADLAGDHEEIGILWIAEEVSLVARPPGGSIHAGQVVIDGALSSGDVATTIDGVDGGAGRKPVLVGPPHGRAVGAAPPTLSWSPVSGNAEPGLSVPSYLVEIGATGTPGPGGDVVPGWTETSVGATTATAPGAAPGTYYWRVTCLETGETSETWAFVVPAERPAIPPPETQSTTPSSPGRYVDGSWGPTCSAAPGRSAGVALLPILALCLAAFARRTP